jgi:hypothetical protein
MAHGILIESKIAAKDIDALNRSVVATADVDAGSLLALTAPSTVGEDRWTVAQPSASALTDLWIAYNPTARITKIDDLEFAGLSVDDRRYTNVANKTFDAFKPKVGDEIEFSVDCVDPSAVASVVAGDYLDSVAGSFKLASVMPEAEEVAEGEEAPALGNGTNDIKVQTTSGAGASNVGVAGSLAIAVINMTYAAEIPVEVTAEEGIEVPFKIQRVYWIHGVPEGEERGMHSNRVCWEYVVAVNGSVDITLEDAEGRRTYRLDSKKKGLLIPPDTWDEIRNFSHDAVLLVLASHSYDEGAYVNSYEEFLKSIGK